MRKSLVLMGLVVGLMVATVGLTLADFSSISTKPITAAIEFIETGSATMSVELQNVNPDDPGSPTEITWGKTTYPSAHLVKAGDGWKYADQLVVLAVTSTVSGWGVQIYTDNTSGTASPKYVGSALDPMGLVQGDGLLNLLMCWKIMDDKWTKDTTLGDLGPGPADPIQKADPEIENSYYFYNNYLWFKDKATVDNLATSTDETFLNGEDYITVVNALGIKYGASPEERGGGIGAGDPNYIYFGADFRKATTPNTYATTLTLELYAP